MSDMEIKMKRILRVGNAAIVMFFCCILCCTVCGERTQDDTTESASESSTTSTTSTISVKKDGSISSKIVEAFTESYYDVDGLKTMIETSIADYQAKNAAAQVKLKSCKAKGSNVDVVMEFGDHQSYAGFNDEVFFAGTVQEANKAGFDLNMSLKGASANQENTMISKADLLGMGDNHIVIFELPVDEEEAAQSVRVECYDEILYVGDGVTVTGKKSADVIASEGYKVIVFR